MISTLAEGTIGALALSILFCGVAMGQQTPPPPSQCPVLASLASSRLKTDKGENIVIWFWNQGNKTTHGIEFQLMMLDAAGNRYPASQRYLATGNTKPKSGDVVTYPAKSEQEHFGATWENIEGVEVYVTSVMFADASTWKPKRGVVCKMAFINSDYEKEIEERMKTWDREHPDKPKKP